ncbi:hypothetical protein [Synechococcus phage S-H34]|uniref:Uncharacterized protein n=1 Tax=Synechococcus phage S-H34 TaxID=2718942 RepID=A0A6G8R6T6_9CAUD|nr:hypothetical protein PQC15_gp232 [Synechococcus phage S-H34]QIN97116.1 hypothetical protein [Synechococcus phage S-H34]
MNFLNVIKQKQQKKTAVKAAATAQLIKASKKAIF